MLKIFFSFYFEDILIFFLAEKNQQKPKIISIFIFEKINIIITSTKISDIPKTFPFFWYICCFSYKPNVFLHNQPALD
jgi:hypothetical protein